MRPPGGARAAEERRGTNGGRVKNPPLRRCALLCVALIIGGPRPAGAQGNTDETLQRAIRLYEDLQIERALPLFRQVISPSSPFVVSSHQRVTAYKYLGAAHAILGQRDSASVYFRAAIERDPFVDLDAEMFTAQERAVFAEARQRTFAIAVRPITRTRIDPSTEHMSFVLLSTHGADLSAEVRTAAGEASPIFQSENDGVREVTWNGVLASGRLAPPGRYELVVRGTSRLTQRTDSTRVYFTVEHDRPPLEDTLPPLSAAELLPEHYPASAATRQLAAGLGVAFAAITIPSVVGRGAFAHDERGLAITTGLVGAVVGALAFRWRHEHRDFTANIAENAHRQAVRAATNAEIVSRNGQKLAQTALVISPAAGVGVGP